MVSVRAQLQVFLTAGATVFVTTSHRDVVFDSTSIATPMILDHEANYALVEALIEKTEGVVGGAARIARTRIPVWTLVNYWRLGASDTEVLAAFPSLRPADLNAAREYAFLNRLEVDRDIAENEAA